MTPDYALHEISYLNAMMYSFAVPLLNDEEDDENAPLFDETKDACDADNFEDFEDEIEIKAR